MIKLDKIGKQAIYFTSPYESHIHLTTPTIKSVKWNNNGTQGVMIVTKNDNDYKLGLFPKVAKSHGNLEKVTNKANHTAVKSIVADLSKVGTKDYGIGFIYNVKSIY